MNLKARLQEHSQERKVKWEVIEQDYILSWVLKGFSQIPVLKNNLVFKGGTALKKMYFGDYRFSQDLDFSVKNEGKDLAQLDEFIDQACLRATEATQSLGENVEFRSEPYLEKKPHPEGQKAFLIEARLPWHRDFHTKVYAEFSFQEIILMEPQKRNIIHGYGEAFEEFVYVYPLEEIVAEKIRALLQFAKKLHERGWGRSRVRDYYDIWRIMGAYSDTLKLDILPILVDQKCAHKGISFAGIDDVFQKKLMLNLEKEWDSWLQDIVPNLPKKDRVIGDLKRILGKVFNNHKS
ncbi:MAG: nucleotidyl transferase AbiEii/AbiGii toxin family protein [Flavobacteriales bacterium]|nr:nucleotidyl transferase AbiEii/AbiGii toxin family protein [Flavobacteriales bacterium]